MIYDIIQNKDPEDLARQVNQRLSEGWVPLGGVAYAESAAARGREGYEEVQYDWLFVQAMTRAGSLPAKVIPLEAA